MNYLNYSMEIWADWIFQTLQGGPADKKLPISYLGERRRRIGRPKTSIFKKYKGDSGSDPVLDGHIFGLTLIVQELSLRFW